MVIIKKFKKYYDPIESSEILNEAYKRFLKSIFQIKNSEIYEKFINKIDVYEFSKGPFIETTPPFKKGKSFQELIDEGLLNPLFEKFIFEVHSFLTTNMLYKHQEQSIRKILNNRNIVITSSTSSGKTECFLYPIYNELLKQYKEGLLGPGVRVLLLYPMNALVNDQLRKLRDIAYAIEKNIDGLRITYGRYTGDTEEYRKDALEQFKNLHRDKEPPKSELLSREEMRSNPPNILITNYAMLEYLLLRPEDDIFFTGEYGNDWKYIVLDEGHVYNGATGMEIGMLLRRVKERINRESKKPITAIIASATLITSSSDYDKVINFANNLFGEKFEWNENNQDIVIGERESVKDEKRFFLTKNEFEELYDLFIEYKNTNDNSTIKEWLNDRAKDYEIYLDKDPIENLYQFLKYEGNIITIKELLRESALDFREMAKRFFNKEFKDIEIVKKIIEIGVWLRRSKDEMSLIPARFHYFLRTPESVFVSFVPQIEIYLERHKIILYKDLEVPVFELHVCKRCGQPYFFGNITENSFYEQLESQIIFSDEPTKFLMFLEKEDLMEFEENDFESMEKLCVSCGKVMRRGHCTCNNPMEYPIQIISKEGRNLTKCQACEYSSPAINRILILNRDTPSAVIATNLFQNAPKNEKLLAFTDNRQKAAFFAPFIEFTYKLLLFRHLILKAIHKLNVQDLRLEGLSIQLKKLCEKEQIFPLTMDDVQKKLLSWRHIINEFYNISSRNSLETLGLIKFSIIFPENWLPPSFLKISPWNLTDQQIKALYQMLLNTLRKNKAFSMPEDGPRYDDEIFERVGNKKQWFFKGQLREGEKGRGNKGIISFIPRRKINSRINVLKKILKSKNSDLNKDEIQQISEACLSDIWEDILGNWISGCREDIFYRQNSTYQLNHQFWNVSLQDLEELYICDKCSHITHLNIENVCPTYRCTGILIPDIDRIRDFLDNNHFSNIYNNFKSKKLKAREHTAQLTTDKATKTQMNFINGDVDLLSCSTTFELGVDLGDLQIIFLTNIPPHPSNYVQRAGRAGRRKDSAGFTVSLALLRSHDLTYFYDPIKMINGYIKPPIINIKNEKIILRHINSIILSQFFKLNPRYYYGEGRTGKVKWFLFNENLEIASAYDLIREYINDNFELLKNRIEKILPHDLEKRKKFLSKDVILNNLYADGSQKFGEFGKFYLANINASNEVENLQKIHDENSQKYITTKNPRERDKIHYFNKWIEKRIETIKNEPLINFLSKYSIIPKYGFPIDVVPLDILYSDQNSKEVALERDLKIAISEYAPGSSVVANAKIWKSVGLKTLKDQTWPIYEYLFCPICEQFNKRDFYKQQSPSQDEFKCINCGINLESERKFKFIDPIFGFLTDRNEKPIKPGRESPQKQYFSRPFFHSLTPTKNGRFVEIEKDRNIIIDWEYAPNGELTVLCRGKKDTGFVICYDCGRGWNQDPNLKQSHITPYGYNCNGMLHRGIHLGHRFQTDILRLTFQKSIDANVKVGYSLLYAILEGVSEELQINRNDIDGCLFNRNDEINNSLIFFDNVPGGAGHVRRIIESEEIFIKILNSAIAKLEKCICGEETSCYGCLRNYSNQFCHAKLSRGEALGILNDIFPKELYEIIIDDELQISEVISGVELIEERKEAFGKISDFEIKIRKFIKDQLKIKYNNIWWEKGIPKSIKDDVDKKIKSEIATKQDISKKINNLDFSHYKLIIFYKENKDIFSKYFPDYGIQYLFDRLRFLRNKVHHAKSTHENHEKIDTYKNDILRLIPE